MEFIRGIYLEAQRTALQAEGRRPPGGMPMGELESSSGGLAPGPAEMAGSAAVPGGAGQRPDSGRDAPDADTATPSLSPQDASRAVAGYLVEQPDVTLSTANGSVSLSDSQESVSDSVARPPDRGLEREADSVDDPFPPARRQDDGPARQEPRNGSEGTRRWSVESPSHALTVPEPGGPGHSAQRPGPASAFSPAPDAPPDGVSAPSVEPGRDPASGLPPASAYPEPGTVPGARAATARTGDEAGRHAPTVAPSGDASPPEEGPASVLPASDTTASSTMPPRGGQARDVRSGVEPGDGPALRPTGAPFERHDAGSPPACREGPATPPSRGLHEPDVASHSPDPGRPRAASPRRELVEPLLSPPPEESRPRRQAPHGEASVHIGRVEVVVEEAGTEAGSPVSPSAWSSLSSRRYMRRP
ncbi:hypothetical protein BDK63_002281 [Halomonas campaniensis]|uniref:Uncharacterized protein n=1 Tax=Halomonas campaniensis TaxID=213554 RepID=A0A7W5K3Y3_9GAMM|nr:hypothetical protein [Halomonas campaniensis]